MKQEMKLFYYCQAQIEGLKKCRAQCEHCKIYYKPLEEQKKVERVISLLKELSSEQRMETFVSIAELKMKIQIANVGMD